MRRDLVSTQARAVALLGQHVRLALQGMGGVGKSVLAAALARDEEVQRAFPDGVFWLTLGQTPEEPLLAQARIAKAVGGAQVSLQSVEDGKAILGELFEKRACLLVLDDVWEHRHAEPFNVLGERGKLLVTTRNEEVSRGLDAEPRVLHELRDVDALELLARYSGLSRDALPPEAPALARECGELPLALAMAGSMLRGRPLDRWSTLLARLRKADLARLSAALPQYRYGSVLAAIEVSVEELPPEVRARYLDLAVFPEDTPIPEGVLRTFWAPEGLDAGDVQEVVDALMAHSLVRRDNQWGTAVWDQSRWGDTHGRLMLHDLQHDYVRARAGDLKPLHARLIAAYRRLGGEEGLRAVPDDGYCLQHLAPHLVAAGERSALRELLLDVRWLAAKLAKTKETNTLLADFLHLDLDADEPVRLLHDALRLSSHVLDSHPEELAGQLIGRLGDEEAPELRAIVAHASRLAPCPGFVPQWPRLTPPGGPLVCSLEGHQGGINAAAISPDGKLALSGSADATLKLWEVPSGRLVRSFDGRQPGIKEHWDAADGRVRSFKGHQGGVNAVAISPNGKLALSGSDDTTLKLWELASGRLIRSFHGHQRAVNAVVLSADGEYALSGSDDATLKLWELASGKLVRSFAGHQGGVKSVALSADGRYALSGSADTTLGLWEVTSGKLVRSFQGHRYAVNAVALSADGKHAVSGSHESTINVWEVASGKPVRFLNGHRYGVNTVALSADGKYLLSGSSDRALKLWDVTSGTVLRSFEGHQGGIIAAALSPNGRHALSGAEDKTLKLWEMSSGKRARSMVREQGWVRAVALSPNGDYALSGSDAMPSLKLWGLASGRRERSFENHDPINAVAISSNGRYAVSGSSARDIKLWETASGRLVRSFKGHEGRVTAVALSPDSRYVLSGSSDKSVRLWDLASGKPMWSREGHLNWVWSVAVSADGRLALSGSEDKTLSLWEVASGKLLRSFEGHDGRVTAVALAANGRYVLSGSHDRTLKLWDLRSGNLTRSFEGHDGWVNAVGLTADGQHAFSGSEDKTLKLWELATARVLASFTGDAAFLSLDVSSDGRRVVAGDKAGGFHLFEVLL